MAKKYLSLEGLVEYDSLLKASYQEALNQISSGTTVVGKAQEATHAESATTANSAIEATQDGNGKVISETYETKADAAEKLEEAKDYTDEKIATKTGVTVKTWTSADV